MARPVAAFTALGLLAFALAGCAHEPAADSGYRWAFLKDAGEAPRLAYGRPFSDDVILMLSCSPGADSVNISAIGLKGAEIVLASRKIQSRFAARKTESALGDNGLLEASGRMSAPALAGFQHTGDLVVVTEGRRHSLSASRQDEGQVKAFFRSCAAA